MKYQPDLVVIFSKDPKYLTENGRSAVRGRTWRIRADRLLLGAHDTGAARVPRARKSATPQIAVFS